MFRNVMLLCVCDVMFFLLRSVMVRCVYNEDARNSHTAIRNPKSGIKQVGKLVSMYVSMYLCTCLCIYVRIYVSMYVSMCLGMYLCTYLCSYHDSTGWNLAFSSTGEFALSVAIRSRKISVQSGSAGLGRQLTGADESKLCYFRGIQKWCYSRGKIGLAARGVPPM